MTSWLLRIVQPSTGGQAFFPTAAFDLAVDARDIPIGLMLLTGAHLDALFVDPDRRSQGVGKALVQEALRRRPVLTTDVNEQNALKLSRSICAWVSGRLAARNATDRGDCIPCYTCRGDCGSASPTSAGIVPPAHPFPTGAEYRDAEATRSATDRAASCRAGRPA